MDRLLSRIRLLLPVVLAWRPSQRWVWQFTTITGAAGAVLTLVLFLHQNGAAHAPPETSVKLKRDAGSLPRSGFDDFKFDEQTSRGELSAAAEDPFAAPSRDDAEVDIDSFSAEFVADNSEPVRAEKTVPSLADESPSVEAEEELFRARRRKKTEAAPTEVALVNPVPAGQDPDFAEPLTVPEKRQQRGPTPIQLDFSEPVEEIEVPAPQDRVQPAPHSPPVEKPALDAADFAPLTKPEPAAKLEPTPESEPAFEPETKPEPLAKSEPIVEPEPVTRPEPAAQPEPPVEPQIVNEPKAEEPQPGSPQQLLIADASKPRAASRRPHFGDDDEAPSKASPARSGGTSSAAAGRKDRPAIGDDDEHFSKPGRALPPRGQTVANEGPETPRETPAAEPESRHGGKGWAADGDNFSRQKPPPSRDLQPDASGHQDIFNSEDRQPGTPDAQPAGQAPGADSADQNEPAPTEREPRPAPVRTLPRQEQDDPMPKPGRPRNRPEPIRDSQPAVPESSAEPAHAPADSSPSAAQRRFVPARAPKLKMELEAPRQVAVGDQVTLFFRISNVGNLPATGVVASDELPPGLRHARSADLEYRIGQLAPGESRRARLNLTATRPGRVINRAVVTADGGGFVEKAVEVRVIERRISVAYSGPECSSVGCAATYAAAIGNPGKHPLVKVIVASKLPSGARFASATAGGRYDPETQSVVWRLARIEPGERELLEARVTLTAEGTQISELQVRDEAGDAGDARWDTRVVRPAPLCEVAPY